MCVLLRPRTNEGLKVKEVNVIWMDTWGFLNRTNNITQSCFFFSFYLYMYHSYIFFHLKESTTVTTDKQRTKRMQQKNIQKCGGQFAPNSVWLGPSNKTKYFFFSSFTEEQESLLFVFMDVQILTKKVFRRNYLLMNSLKNVSLEQSWYGPLFRLRILFLIKILTNLFFYLSSLLLIFSFFFLYSLISD